jgi:TRAP-type C4-dicarboxylate transport system permease small subunit
VLAGELLAALVIMAGIAILARRADHLAVSAPVAAAQRAEMRLELG